MELNALTSIGEIIRLTKQDTVIVRLSRKNNGMIDVKKIILHSD